MSKLLQRFGFGLWSALMAVVSTPSYANLVSVNVTPAVQDANLTWPGAPAYVSMPSGASGLGVATFDQHMPNPSHLGNSFGVLAEIFTPQTGSTFGAPNNQAFTIQNIALFASGGGPAVVVYMHLYDITSTLVGAPNGTDANTTYAPTTDLLGGGNGLSFQWNPGALVPPANTFLTIFTLDDQSGSGGTDDQVDIQLNHNYALELVCESIDDTSFIWRRRVMSTVDPGGMAMATRDPADPRITLALAGLSGGASRAMTLAFNVPEPGTIVLAGLAACGLLFMRPRHKAA